MLDIVTARVVLVAVAGCVLLLFYLGPYRATRSRFTLWWCVSLLASFASTAAFLFNGTAAQVVTNPLGSVFAAAGTTFMWFSARAVVGATRPAWTLALATLPVAIAAAVDHPSTNVWAGGAVMLGVMAAGMTASGWELARAARGVDVPPTERAGRGAHQALVALATAASVLGLFYAARAVAFLVAGSELVATGALLGSAATSVLLTLMMVVATFSVGELSHYETTRDLRRRAAHDDLTGLLTRSEFLARADEHRRMSPESRAVVVIADLDHFKSLNDTRGHAAGDRALLAFGTACRRVVAGRGFAGRIGGEEFAVLLTVGDSAEAVELADAISTAYSAAVQGDESLTVSYGIARARAGEPLDRVLARADSALYRAKREGRDRAEVDE